MKIFLSVRKNSNLDFLLTFSHFLIFYDHDGLFEMILWLKKFGLEKVDQKSKFDFLSRWIFIRWLRICLMKKHGFCNVLNQEISSRCCIEDVKINLQANRSSIEQKVNDSLSSIKILIGRFKVDHEKKLGIWKIKCWWLIKIDQLRWVKTQTLIDYILNRWNFW